MLFATSTFFNIFSCQNCNILYILIELETVLFVVVEDLGCFFGSLLTLVGAVLGHFPLRIHPKVFMNPKAHSLIYGMSGSVL